MAANLPFGTRVVMTIRTSMTLRLRSWSYNTPGQHKRRSGDRRKLLFQHCSPIIALPQDIVGIMLTSPAKWWVVPRL